MGVTEDDPLRRVRSCISQVLDLFNTTPDVTADPASTPALMPHLDDRRLNVDDKACARARIRTAQARA